MMGTQLASRETQDIVDQVRAQLEEKEKKSPVFKAVSFKRVVGTNCFIKMYIGDEDFIHLGVFRIGVSPCWSVWSRILTS
uniref:Cystatin-B n=1 Tax=Theropithecus gelada TaxID=9565 RepID=A0A8D2EH11_THEGE